MSVIKSALFKLGVCALIVILPSFAPPAKRYFDQWVINGQWYLSTASGLELAKVNSFEVILPLEDDRITCLHFANDELLAGTFNGILYTQKNTNWTQIPLPKQKNKEPFLINGICIKDEKKWISTLEGTIFSLDAEQEFKAYPLYKPKSDQTENITGLSLDNSNQLWVTTLSQVYFLTNIHQGRNKNYDFLASSDLREPNAKLFDSPEGNFIWTRIKGKNRLRIGTLSSRLMDALSNDILLPKQLQTEQVLSITRNPTGMWFLVKDKLYLYRNLQWLSQSLEKSQTENVQSFVVFNGAIHLCAPDKQWTLALNLSPIE